MPHVDYWADAETLAVEKPQPLAYRRAIERWRREDPSFFADITSRQTLIAGDDYECDYRVPRESMGWQAKLLLRSPPLATDQPSAADRIDSLMELLPLLHIHTK